MFKMDEILSNTTRLTLHRHIKYELQIDMSAKLIMTMPVSFCVAVLTQYKSDDREQTLAQHALLAPTKNVNNNNYFSVMNG
jgi:hypothetical protein